MFHDKLLSQLGTQESSELRDGEAFFFLSFLECVPVDMCFVKQRD
jgi:hypothetical protein